MIPELDPATGRLPFVDARAPCEASVAEVHERFVDGVPAPQHRQRIWAAFELWHSLASDVFPNARLWISGSFLTDVDRPSDLDVVLVLEPEHGYRLSPLDPKARVLLTHQELRARHPPGTAPRLQAMGGLIDGHVCPGWVPDQVAHWQEQWSTEFDESQRPTGVRLGYVEVSR